MVRAMLLAAGAMGCLVVLQGCVREVVVERQAPPRVVYMQAPAAGTEVVVEQPVPQPARVVEVITVSPGPEYVWIGGCHEWVGGRWVWMGGHWERPIHPHAVWVEGSWHRGHRGYNWDRGHWR